MDETNGRKQQVTAEQERMLKKVAKVAARMLTPIETHSICVLLSMAFGRGTLQSRTFAWHVNGVRRALGLPQVTQAAAHPLFPCRAHFSPPILSYIRTNWFTRT
jgi:hypothetical protein